MQYFPTDFFQGTDTYFVRDIDSLPKPTNSENLTTVLSDKITIICVSGLLGNLTVFHRELDALLILSSWCLVIVVWLFLEVHRFCLQFVLVVFPNHTHLLCIC